MTTVTEKIASAHVIRFDGAYLELNLEQKNQLTYGKITEIMEELKATLPIREYSCRLPSLEQIYIKFTNQDELKVLN